MRRLHRKPQRIAVADLLLGHRGRGLDGRGARAGVDAVDSEIEHGLAEPMDGDRMPRDPGARRDHDAAAPVGDGIIDPSRPAVAARRARYTEGARQPARIVACSVMQLGWKTSAFQANVVHEQWHSASAKNARKMPGRCARSVRLARVASEIVARRCTPRVG